MGFDQNIFHEDFRTTEIIFESFERNWVRWCFGFRGIRTDLLFGVHRVENTAPGIGIISLEQLQIEGCQMQFGRARSVWRDDIVIERTCASGVFPQP